MVESNFNFTEKWLKIVYFFITRKQFFKKMLIVFLIFLDLFIIFYLILNIVKYQNQTKEQEKILKELTTQNITYQPIPPLPIEIISTKAISLGSFRYHLICEIMNPNKDWFAKSFNYQFFSSNFSTPLFSSFVLPEENKFLIVLNQKIITGSVKDLSCQIGNISWQKIKSSQYQLLDILKDFLIKDLKHFPGKEDKKDVTVFKFVNNSVYNFWEINLIILAYQGNEIVGVEKFPIKEIKSHEEREIKIVWPNQLFYVSEIKVYPEINIFDSSQFFLPKLKPKE